VFCFECLTFKNGENNKKKYGTCALEEDDSQGSDQTIEVVRVTMTFTTEKKNVRKWWIFASTSNFAFLQKENLHKRHGKSHNLWSKKILCASIDQQFHRSLTGSEDRQ
jgi:hypothetical protein